MAWSRRKLTIRLMALAIMLFYFYIFTSTITIDTYISRYHTAQVRSVSLVNTTAVLDLVEPRLDDFMKERNIQGDFDWKLFPNNILNKELEAENKVNIDSENSNRKELIPPILDIDSNLPLKARADSVGNLTIGQNSADTHNNDNGVLEVQLQNNDNKEINGPPNPEHNKELQNGVNQVRQFLAEAGPKDAVVHDSTTEHSEVIAEVNNDDCTEVSKGKTYGAVTFPEFIAVGKPGDPGENGARFQFKSSSLTIQEEKKKDEDFKIHFFDEWISKKIAVRRSLPDNRLQWCKKERNATLPAVSVLIVFYNEAWTTLLRTIHSVLDRTPDSLLKEIILLDDFSNMDHLMEPLEVYLKPLPKVRLFRAKERLGLIKARNVVFELASAKVVVFLDSHIECFPGWLQPLLTPILADSKAVTFPVIEYINPATFGVGINNAQTNVGGLNLKTLSFNWLYSRTSTVNDVFESTPSPTMPGGLYAISREFFKQLGKYDPGMELWGFENLEISFKVWMCGGSVLLVRCSHVGHIFRRKNPAVRDSGGAITYKNAVRVAEVWMDQYKHFFYEKLAYSIPEYGDVSSRVQLRNSLQCHDFGWYLENVYPELKAEMGEFSTYVGQIKNEDTNMCMDRSVERFLAVSPCSRSIRPTQFWTLSSKGVIASSDKAIGLEIVNDGVNITKQRLGVFSEGKYGNNVDINWSYDTKMRLVHKTTGQCLQVDYVLRQVELQDCSFSPRQKWVILTREEIKAAYVALGVSINWNQ